MSGEQQQSLQKGQESVQLCSVRADGGMYGIETCAVREVLGHALPQRVPLAPAHIAGVLTYRGEVLEAVSLRNLLGLAAAREDRVLVLEDSGGERFGLMVESVDGIVTVLESSRESNPATLEARSVAIFNGVYRMEEGLMVRLNMEMLGPAELGHSTAFNRDTQAEVR